MMNMSVEYMNVLCVVVVLIELSRPVSTYVYTVLVSYSTARRQFANLRVCTVVGVN